MNELPAEAIEIPMEFYGSGIYFLYRGDECVYVGRSINVSSRVAYHINNMVEFDKVYFIPKPVKELSSEEKYWIEKLQPKNNIKYRNYPSWM
jgi:hypothetical protein